MSEYQFKTPEHAAIYSEFRPTPPVELLARILSQSSSTDSLLDVGCGSGQSTELMTKYFKHVVGIDVSEAQLAQAEVRRKEKKLTNLEYRLSPAENMVFADESFDVITGSQSVHWFNLDKFYLEAYRVLRKSGLLALFGYCLPIPRIGEAAVDEAIETRLLQHYRQDLGPYWELDRTLIDTRYETLAVPKRGFQLIEKNLSIVKKWPTDIDSYMEYLATWSSYEKFRKQNPEIDILGQLKSDLQKILQKSHQSTSDDNRKLSIDTNCFLYVYKKQD